VAAGAAGKDVDTRAVTDTVFTDQSRLQTILRRRCSLGWLHAFERLCVHPERRADIQKH